MTSDSPHSVELASLHANQNHHLMIIMLYSPMVLILKSLPNVDEPYLNLAALDQL